MKQTPTQSKVLKPLSSLIPENLEAERQMLLKLNPGISLSELGLWMTPSPSEWVN